MDYKEFKKEALKMSLKEKINSLITKISYYTILNWERLNMRIPIRKRVKYSWEYLRRAWRKGTYNVSDMKKIHIERVSYRPIEKPSLRILLSPRELKDAYNRKGFLEFEYTTPQEEASDIQFPSYIITYRLPLREKLVFPVREEDNMNYLFSRSVLFANVDNRNVTQEVKKRSGPKNDFYKEIKGAVFYPAFLLRKGETKLNFIDQYGTEYCFEQDKQVSLNESDPIEEILNIPELAIKSSE